MKNTYLIPIGSSFLMIIGIFLIRKFLPPEVPLLYGNIRGQTQLVPTLFLIAAPAGSILVSLVNYGISKVISDKFFKKALLIGSILINLMVFITLVKIIFLVGFF